jgi:hypothetical protein
MTTQTTRKTVEERAQEGEGWAIRHLRALAYPRGTEVPPVALLRALRAYAASLRAQGYTMGTDYYAAPLLADILSAASGLLSLDIGRLDAGEMDHALRALATENDIDGETI